MWVDGMLKGTWTGLSFRTSDVLKLNSLTLEAVPMGGTEGVTRRLLVDDSLVAAVPVTTLVAAALIVPSEPMATAPA